MGADAFRGQVGAQRKQLVAQRQQAARLEANDRHAARGERRIGCNQTIEFATGVVDKTGRQKRPPAAERPAALGGCWHMHAVSAVDQHAQCRVEIFALVEAIEGIGEQHHLAAIFGPDRDGVGPEHVAPERGQGARGADAGEFLE